MAFFGVVVAVTNDKPSSSLLWISRESIRCLKKCHGGKGSVVVGGGVVAVVGVAVEIVRKSISVPVLLTVASL